VTAVRHEAQDTDDNADTGTHSRGRWRWRVSTHHDVWRSSSR